MKFRIPNLLKQNHQCVKIKNITGDGRAHPAKGLKQVSLGKADGFIGSLGIINYIIKKQFLNNVHVAAEVSLDRDLPLYMAVRKDWGLLADILDKAMEQVDPRQYDAVVSKWIGSMEQTGDMIKLSRDHFLPWQIRPRKSVFISRKRKWLT